MEKSKKLYSKAMDNYNKGNIDKAIELCEKSISIDLKNNAAINLKGLLYYLKGDLNSAQKIWKMNSQLNKNKVAEKYLNDSKEDCHRLKLYIKAISLINELKIREALEILLMCKKSDFNSINVNNNLCICYIKTGEHEKAKQCIKDILELDKKNSNAIDNLKLLQELGVETKGFIVKKTVIIFSIIFIATMVVGSVYVAKHYSLGTKVYSLFKKQAKPQEKLVVAKKQPQVAKKEVAAPKKEKAVEQLSQEKATEALNNKNYDEIYAILQLYKGKDLNLNDKTLYMKLEEEMVKDGVASFYKNAGTFMTSKDYNNSVKELSKAYNYSSNTFLNPHIIFMLATNFQQLGDMENAIKMYNEYDIKYPKGDYEETVLYKMALIYMNTDKSKAKTYGEKLSNRFPQSIYYNSNIKGILGE